MEISRLFRNICVFPRIATGEEKIVFLLQKLETKEGVDWVLRKTAKNDFPFWENRDSSAFLRNIHNHGYSIGK